MSRYPTAGQLDYLASLVSLCGRQAAKTATAEIAYAACVTPLDVTDPEKAEQATKQQVSAAIDALRRIAPARRDRRYGRPVR